MFEISKQSQLGPEKKSTQNKWRRTRAKWLKENPPDYKGYYYCEIEGCLLPQIPMTRQEMTLDHIQRRGSHPNLIHTLSNLRPAHSACNMARESTSLFNRPLGDRLEK